MGTLIYKYQSAIKKYADNIAVEFEDAGGNFSQWSYKQLDENVRSISSFLKSKNIQKSDCVIIFMPNCAQWISVYFAIIRSGGVVVPLDIHMTNDTIRNIINDSNSKLIISSGNLKEKLDALVDIQNKIILIESINQYSMDEVNVQIEPDDLACIMYTSGTTDTPKGVMLTHKNLCANIDSIDKLKMVSSGDSVLSVLPYHHSYAIMVNLLAPVLFGGKIVLPHTLRSENLFRCFKSSNITIFTVVPQILYMIHKGIKDQLKQGSLLKHFMFSGLSNIGNLFRCITSINFNKLLLKPMHNKFGTKFKYFACGGASLNTDIERDFKKWGFTILQGYGLTETSPIVTFNPPNKTKIGSVGKAMPGVKIDTSERDSKGVGEVIISGDNVMKGYYKKDQETQKCIKGKWFYSEDLGYIDKQGYLYLTGRKKEVIVLSSGKNIYPEDVENHYLKSWYIKEICVIQIHDTNTNLEVLHALIFPDLNKLKTDGQINLQEVLTGQIENLSHQLPEYQRLKGFTIIKEELPRTALGKIKRYEVTKQYEPSMLKEQKTKEPVCEENMIGDKTDIAQKISACLKKTFNLKKNPGLSDSLELDLGITSLGRVELLDALEQTFGISVPDEFMDIEIFTVKDLINHTAQLLHAKGKIEQDKHEAEKRKTSQLWQDILLTNPQEEALKNIRLAPTRLDKFLTGSVPKIVWLFFKIFHNLKVYGKENLPKQGPYLLCVNHTSYYDGSIIAVSVPFYCEIMLFFLGFRAYFTVFPLRHWLRTMRVIPIDLSAHMIEAMQASSYILRNNKALCVFPEGERSIDGEIKEFKKGIGILIKELKLGIVPVYIKGAFETWPRTSRFPKPHPIQVHFGEYSTYQQLQEQAKGMGSEDEYQALAGIVKSKVKQLRSKF